MEIVFWLLFIFFLVASFLDWKSSLGMEYIGTFEGVKFNRDKDGFFAEKKNAVLTTVVAIAPLILYFAISKPSEKLMIGAIIYAPLGIYRLILYFSNIKKQKRARARQIETLEAFLRGDSPNVQIRSFNNVHYATLFGVFNSDLPKDAAIISINKKLRALSHYPRDKWFDRATMDKVQKEVN